MPYQKVKDGVFFNAKMGRLVNHQGYATSIHWSPSMLDYLRRHFPTMLNDELAGCLGVSPRTVIRKARQLGLQKDEQWLAEVWEERRKMAQCASKRKGHPGAFKKGVRANPAGEFKKGQTCSPEVEQKRVDSMKRWYKQHPVAASAKARKAWDTRRARINQTTNI